MLPGSSARIIGSLISGYTLISNEITVDWDGLDDLTPITYLYKERQNTGSGSGSGGSGTGSGTIIPPANKTDNDNNDYVQILVSSNLTIKCVNEDGTELFVQKITTVEGSSEMINAPPLRGYKLAENEAPNRVTIISAEDMVVTFVYSEDNSETNYSIISYLIASFLCGFILMFVIHYMIMKQRK